MRRLAILIGSACPTVEAHAQLTYPTKVAASEETSKDKPLKDRRDEGQLVNTLHDMFQALRVCWMPPPPEKSRPGMEYTIRFAFKSNGELIAPARVTYSTHGVPEECATFITRRWKRRFDAARRCFSRPVWRAPSPDARSSFASSTIAS